MTRRGDHERLTFAQRRLLEIARSFGSTGATASNRFALQAARRPDEATSPMRSRGCLLAGLVVRSAWALARSLITLSKPPSGAGAVRVVREADARGLRPEAEYCGKRCRAGKLAVRARGQAKRGAGDCDCDASRLDRGAHVV
jgi:hypothetical protein